MADDPAATFKGTLLILAPHMDDEALACGGTIALLPNPARIHVVYATDGSRSPVRPFSRRDGGDELKAVRRSEAREAMGVLGVPDANLRFLELPDGKLRDHADRLTAALRDILAEIGPDHCFLPFRYDRHADHLALRRATLKAVLHLERPPRLLEYFVYYRWRLLPGGDVRGYVRQDRLVEIDIRAVGDRKLAALKCYRSQTTLYRAWQRRPILPEERLMTVSTMPELFLRCDDREPGSRVLSRMRLWIPAAHRIEPVLKRMKEAGRALVQPGEGNHAR